MAISLATVWECRASTGADTNGGGFVAGASGTDWSQQDAAQYSVTDAVTNGTTTITSASANFGTDVVGNILYIQGGTAGITAGWYEITGRTNATTITVDRSTGLTAGTGATLKIGGALATIATAFAAARINNTIYLKGTFTVTTALTASFSDSKPFKFIGYTTTRGDNGKATWTTATNSINLITFGTVAGYIFKNIIFSSTAATPGYGWSAGNAGAVNAIVARNCRFTGFNVGIWGPFSTQYYFEPLILFDCEVDSCTSYGIRNVGGTILSGCSIHNNGNNGVEQDSILGNLRGFQAVFCAFWENTGKGVNLGAAGTRCFSLINNVFVSNTSDGFYCAGANLEGVLENNIFYNNGAYGINCNDKPAIAQRNNAYYNNTSGARNNIDADDGDVTLTVDPFTDSANGDFSLNSTAGGGAACKQAGFQSSLLG